MATKVTPADVLHFWFKECSAQQWFKKDSEFDSKCAQRFGACVEEALGGGLEDWTESREGCQALIILLDQFTRNIYRDTAKAFAGDARAVKVTQLCVERGYLEGVGPNEGMFLLMPIVHSEDLEVHRSGLPLMEKHTTPAQVDYEHQHRAIIERFGRYPHRNVALGRKSTPEEEEFLTQPGSSF